MPRTKDVPEVRFEVVTVTPEYAEHLLASASGLPQRSLMRRRVAGFAGAMSRDQWLVTHQPVAVDPDGILIDGQHRLSAVVVAARPVRMLVAYNVPRDTFAVIDAGVARSTSQALYIAGYTDVNVTAAAARAVMINDRIRGTLKLPSAEIRAEITTPDVLDFLASDRGRLLIGELAGGRGIAANLSRNGIRTWLTAALMIVREATPRDPELGLHAEFVDRLHSGAMLPSQSPILKFRTWLISDTGYDAVDRNYRQQIGISALIQTWNAWTHGRETGAPIRVRPGREPWPMVGDLTPEIAATLAERQAAFDADAAALAAESAGREMADA